MVLQHIWLVHGYAGSGKDTAAALLASQVKNATISSFASAVKDEVALMYEFDRPYLDTQAGKERIVGFVDGSVHTIRDLIISHAQTQKITYTDPQYWAKRVNPTPETEHWILSDWRFLAEYECLKTRFPNIPIHTLYIYRPSVIPLATETEHELDGFVSEFKVDNSGSLLYLANQLQAILQRVQTE